MNPMKTGADAVTEHEHPPEITARRFTAWMDVTKADCPTCGRPAYLRHGAEELVGHEDAAHDDLCPEIIRRRKILDDVIESYAVATVYEGPTVVHTAARRWSGLVTVPPEALEDVEPDLRSQIVATYEALVNRRECGPDPAPSASPAKAAAHKHAVESGIPLTRWLAPRLRGRLTGSDGWLDREARGGPPDWREVDPFGSLFGRSLLRTGEYLVRPAGTGFDIAEIVEVIA
jgi:hypothetical protein